MSGKGEKTSQKEEERGRSPAEWTTLIASVVVVMALAGLILFDYFMRGSDPPIIEVSPVLEEIRQEGDSFYLPVDVVNKGAETAGGVEVGLTLTGVDGSEESASFMVDFLAGGEVHHQTVIFGMDPRQGELGDITSFSTP